MGAEEEAEEETASGRVRGEGGGKNEAEGGGVAAADTGEAAAAVVSCSICLEAVVAGGQDRSTVMLKCGHEFHLDCIGSAFNAKGIMQCPNCRKIEKGNWLYANGSRASQDVNTDDWGHDEEFYDFSYSETARGVFVPLRFQWCPIGRLAQLPSLLDSEGESSPPVTFHDFMGQNISSEHLATSAPSAAHHVPYIAYFHPVPPPASSSSSHVAEISTDGSTYHDHWNSLTVPSDGRPMQTVHPIDFHHNHWAHMPRSYAQPSSNNGMAEQPGLPVGAMRAGLDGDSQQLGSLPSVYGNGSGSRSRIPSVPPLAPQFMRAHGSINELYPQGSSNLYAGSQLSATVSMRPLGAVGPAVPPLLDSTTFSLFPPGPSSMETEDAGGNQFYAWERDRFAPYPLMPVDSEASWWGSSQQAQGTPEPAPAPAARRLFGQWIGGTGGRSPSSAPAPAPENRSPENSSFRPMHIPRM